MEFSCVANTSSFLIKVVTFDVIPLFQYFSLNWQHQLCKNPRSNPDIKTLFTDHACTPTNGARPPPPTNNPLVGPIPKAGAFPPIGAHNVSNLHL